MRIKKVIISFIILLGIFMSTNVVYADDWYSGDGVKNLWGSYNESAINVINANLDVYMDSLINQDVTKLDQTQKGYYMSVVSSVLGNYNVKGSIYENDTRIQDLADKVEQLKKLDNNTEEDNALIEGLEEDVKNAEESKNNATSAEINTQTGLTEEQIEQAQKEDPIIYNNPDNKDGTSTIVSGSLTIDNVIKDANEFMDKGNEGVAITPFKDDMTSLQNFSKAVSSVLLIVGIVLSVIMGGILGIKFMMGSIEDKAKVKEMLIPYVVGCIVIFGAFAIWQLFVTLFANI